MNEKKKLQPKVRFREFTGENAPDWEQRKFNEIFTKSIINNTLSRADLTYDEGGIKNVHYGDILTKFDYCISSNDLRLPSISKDDDFVSKDELLENGDIVIADTAEDYTTGKAIEIVDSTNKVVAGLHTMAFRPNTKFASGYLGYYFNSIPYRKQLIKYIQGIKVLSISKSNINKTSLTFTTNYDEQLLISKLLSNVEKLITLHQRKLEQLEQLKNTLLSKMFPKSGTNIPEIRFSGFTDAWKQRKLGEVVNRFDNLRIPITESSRISGSTPYYGANGIQDYVEGYTHDGEYILIAEDGANDINNYPVFRVHGKIWVNNHTHVLQTIGDIADNDYVAYALKSINIAPYLVGGSRPKLNADSLMKLEIKLPKLSEQIKIGKIFLRIDYQIENYSQKLKNLKTAKKSLLDKLFI